MGRRITWICLEWPTREGHSGGVGRYAYRLAELVRHSTALTVIARKGALAIPGVKLVEIASSHGRLGRYYLDPLRASRLVAETRPDLVHSFGDDWAVAGRFIKVRTFLGSAVEEARHSTGIRAINHYVLAATEAIAAKRSDVAIGIADESALRFRAAFIMPPILDKPWPASRSPSASPTVVFIGSHQGRKRGWLAERAVADVNATAGKDPAQLIVIGPAQDRPNWPSWVDHRAGLNDAQVSEVLAGAWVLLAPSTYEGFGIPLFEALSAGVPSVASSNPGARYISGGRIPQEALAIASDDNTLGATLAKALTLRGQWSPDTSVAVDERLEELRQLGSHERLLKIYEMAILGQI